MNLLLDTHVLLWCLADDSKLNVKDRNVIVDPENRVYASVASLWEISIKKAIGKLEIPEYDIVEAIKYSEFELLDIKVDHAIKVEFLPFGKDHNDPFDRMLITQAIIEEMVLVTYDKKITLNADIYKVLLLE
ncbi:type II toxin-antitoxin system VapC family toxin [Calothrix sp. FACHB-156]|nr:type II toxin-antitoxin system VapC family toxin [Calothrix sp. FACHB-156]